MAPRKKTGRKPTKGRKGKQASKVGELTPAPPTSLTPPQLESQDDAHDAAHDDARNDAVDASLGQGGLLATASGAPPPENTPSHVSGRAASSMPLAVSKGEAPMPLAVSGGALTMPSAVSENVPSSSRLPPTVLDDGLPDWTVLRNSRSAAASTPRYSSAEVDQLVNEDDLDGLDDRASGGEHEDGAPPNDEENPEAVQAVNPLPPPAPWDKPTPISCTFLDFDHWVIPKSVDMSRKSKISLDPEHGLVAVSYPAITIPIAPEDRDLPPALPSADRILRTLLEGRPPVRFTVGFLFLSTSVVY